MPSFSIATFNTKNLVSPGVNFYKKKDGSWNRYSDQQFQHKVEWMARRLIDMNADHVCLQEVFHHEALQAVADRYNTLLAQTQLGQQPYTEVLHFPNETSNPEDPSPGLGYLGRKHLLSASQIQNLKNDPVEFGGDNGFQYVLGATSRPMVFMQFDMGDGRTATLVNVHLKSKRPQLALDDPANEADNLLFYERHKGQIASLLMRSGEALALRRTLISVMKGNHSPVFVVGDLNDTGSAITTEVIRGEAPWRYEKNAQTRSGFWDVELHSAAEDHLRRSEQSDFVTHIYNGHHCAIDHIFYSQEFYYRTAKDTRVGSLDYARVFNDHLIDSNVSPHTPDDKAASDHGQLVAYFSLY